MSRSPTERVVSHWQKSFSDFQTPSREFYDAVETALDRRAIPGLTVSRVRWREGGVLSPDRDYLRVKVDVFIYDICAAPVGTGYFFSSWASRRPVRLVFVALLLVLAVAALLTGAVVLFASGMGSQEPRTIFQTAWEHPMLTLVAFPVSILVALWGVALVSQIGERDLEDAVLETPLLGALYAQFFAPPTFYRLDTLLMFQSAVHGAVLEAVEVVTRKQGVRALSDDERRPVFADAVLQRAEPVIH